MLRSSQVVWGAVAISFAARLPLIDLPAWPNGAAGFAVAVRHRVSTRICGTWIYVHKGVQRPRPVPRPRPAATAGSRCQTVTVMSASLRQLLAAGE